MMAHRKSSLASAAANNSFDGRKSPHLILKQVTASKNKQHVEEEEGMTLKMKKQMEYK